MPIDLKAVLQEDQQSKRDYKAMKQAERQELIDMQDRDVQIITSDPETYRAYLDIQAANPGLSPGNLAMVLGQKPYATQVASLDKWNRLGRSVSTGQRGIRILVPKRYKDSRGLTRTGFEPDRVFDVSQTTGNRLPPKLQLQEGTPELETALRALIRQCPAAIEPLEYFEDRSVYDPDSRTILLKEGLTDSQTFYYLAKETAHAQFHKNCGDSDYNREDYTTDAESVGYMLCRRFGIDAPQPEAGDLDMLYGEVKSQDRREALEYLQKLTERLGNAVAREVSPPQKERPALEGRER